tara:strand:+ start:440 stop:823 length:384 start_codon:yes stop_codon:yes gene_type:complete
MRIIIFLFIYLLTLAPIYSKSLKTITYPFTAKELIFECEAWIPGETAVQQKAKKEVSCIRYIQSTINTYQLIKSQNNEKLSDLCLPSVLNLQRHKDVFIKYVKENPNKENLDASKIIIESLINSYCK